MREETNQLDQPVLELIVRCRLLRQQKQGHVGADGGRKLHLQAEVTIELV